MTVKCRLLEARAFFGGNSALVVGWWHCFTLSISVGRSNSLAVNDKAMGPGTKASCGISARVTLSIISIMKEDAWGRVGLIPLYVL